MMNALIALGLGIIVFALIVATGLLIMANMSTAVASCPTGWTWNNNGTAGVVFTADTCCRSIAVAPLAGPNCTSNTRSASYGSQSLVTITGYMRNNLVTWIPAVIALGIGLLFIGALMGKKKTQY